MNIDIFKLQDILQDIVMIITTFIALIIFIYTSDIKQVKKWFDIYYVLILIYYLFSIIILPLGK